MLLFETKVLELTSYVEILGERQDCYLDHTGRDLMIDARVEISPVVLRLMKAI